MPPTKSPRTLPTTWPTETVGLIACPRCHDPLADLCQRPGSRKLYLRPTSNIYLAAGVVVCPGCHYQYHWHGR